MDLEGKAVLITGGRRVGGDLARRLAERGASVAMTYHTRREPIELALEEARALGAGALAIAADLSRPEQSERAVAETTEAFGRLDALVSMASVFRRTPFATLRHEDFDAMVAANLAAPYHSAVASARRMLAQEADPGHGLKGKIVFVGDWATERPYADYLPYLVAKGGLTALTLALAKELAPHVAVNLVQPAMIEPPTEFSQAERDEVVALTPLRRVGTPGDMNRLILYLLEGTDFATGASYRVDGGRFLGMDGAPTR